MVGTTNLFYVGAFDGEKVNRLHETKENIPYLPFRELRDVEEEVKDKNWLFEHTIELGGCGCWVFQSNARNMGVTINATRRLVHQMFFGGSANSGKVIQHCKENLCVNPNHYSVR